MIDIETPLLTTPEKAELYRTALDMLNRSGVPYMVGGTYAFQYYAGIARSTKDFDIFVRPRDVQRVLDVLERAGFKTEMAFAQWLARAHGWECTPCRRGDRNNLELRLPLSEWRRRQPVEGGDDDEHASGT